MRQNQIRSNNLFFDFISTADISDQKNIKIKI